MKKRVGKSIALKRNIKNLITSLLPMVKKIINKKINQINQTKSHIMEKIQSNKKVSANMRNNFSVKATKNIVDTPKIDIVKAPIVVEPHVVTS